MCLDIDLNISLEEGRQEIDQHDLHILNDDDCPKNLEPYNGMQFDSQDEAYSSYLMYAKAIGFNISIKASRRSKISREFIDVKYVCSRYGGAKNETPVVSNRSNKVDCKAMLHVKRDSNEKWYVKTFIKDHNHELCPTDHASPFPCHRSISSSGKENIGSALLAVEESTSKIHVGMDNTHGGYENIRYLERDVRNHLDKERGLTLASGDAKAMLEHFLYVQANDPNFFYAMDLDEEQRLRNVFWVDAKSREDYKIFGDVVSFDTTYITNKYKLPFVPFIGVNNHFQPTLFGCALLVDETTSTYVWLMQTWVRAMGGKSPIAILTDQDKAIKEAISIVFQNTQHRFCLWHLLRKIPEKLGHVISNNEDFMGIFNDCIYNSWLEDDFEKKWWNMIENFELEGNEWLETLFEDRKFWVPTYMRDTFLAGMSTTQRSESVNSFFDKYVNKKTSLEEFIEQYEVALGDREEKEVHANFNILHKKPILKTPSPFEKQMSTIYTHGVLKKFQVEVLGAYACFPQREGEIGAMKAFKVQDVEKNINVMVTWEESRQDIRCSCRMFEYHGYLCRHALNVLQALCIYNIPSHLILKRWTKDVRSLDSMSHISNREQSEKQRFDELLHQATKLSVEGSSSHESFVIAYDAIKEALKRCAALNSCLTIQKESQSSLHEVQDKVNVDTSLRRGISLLDPQISRTKGSPKRMKCEIEKNEGREFNNSRKVLKNPQLSISSTESSSQRKGHTIVRDFPVDDHHGMGQDVPYPGEHELLSNISPDTNSQEGNSYSTMETWTQSDSSEDNTFQ